MYGSSKPSVDTIAIARLPEVRKVLGTVHPDASSEFFKRLSEFVTSANQSDTGKQLAAILQNLDRKHREEVSAQEGGYLHLPRGGRRSVSSRL